MSETTNDGAPTVNELDKRGSEADEPKADEPKADEPKADERLASNGALLTWFLNGVKILVPVGTIGFFVLYLILREAYETFYEYFNLRPEDVGLHYPNVLLQSVGAIASLLFPIGLLIYMLLVTRSSRNRLPTGVLMASLAVAYAAAAMRWSRSYGLIAVICALAAIAVFRRKVNPRLIVVIVAALVILIEGWHVNDLLIRDARTTAVLVRLGGGARDSSLFGFTTLTLSARRVNATPLSDEMSIPRQCLMFLGQHDGSTFLFDIRSQRTLVIPASQVLISFSTKTVAVSRHCVRELMALPEGKLDVEEYKQLVDRLEKLFGELDT